MTEDISSTIGALRFLLGLIFNQSQLAEVSWRAPRTLMTRLGAKTCRHIVASTPDAVEAAIRMRPMLHRFPRVMSTYVHGSCVHLMDRHGGDARELWSDKPCARELKRRLEKFPGIGHHKAEVALFLLCTRYDVAIARDNLELDIRELCPRLADLAVGEARPRFARA